MDSLNIVHGTTPGDGWGGAGIYNRGALTVTGCSVSDNAAAGNGGGIQNDGGTLRVDGGNQVTRSSGDYGGGTVELLDVRSFTARMSTIGRPVGARLLEMKVVPATERLARELAIPIGAAVVVITRLRLISDEPMAIESAHFPQALVPGLEQAKLESGTSLYRLLDERYGLRMTGSHKMLELAAASPWEAHHLGIRTGAPLFLLRATQFGASGPIEYLKNLLRGDRFRFQINVEPNPVGEKP